MKRFSIQNFGPIDNVNVSLGDLTIIVGEQASGKSLFLQMLKLAQDKEAIAYNLASMSYDWNSSDKQWLDLYLGMGMGNLYHDNSLFRKDSNPLTIMPRYMPKKKVGESCFYIPAQRILSMPEGRLRSFGEFNPDAPYSLRIFSDDLRRFMENSINQYIFPVPKILDASIKDSISDSIFHKAEIEVSTEMGQRKLVMDVDNMRVPFMTWSAGQKEFMPMLLSFYKLATEAESKNRTINMVIIEEPEMGLHPKAILSILSEVVSLMHKGYQVVISTHSDIVLEFAWAFSMIGKISDLRLRTTALQALFDGNGTIDAFKSLATKKIKTYAFIREGQKIYSKDISSLDAFSTDATVADWGGLSSFADKAQDIVSATSVNI